jgi:hypothetical protein
MHPRFKLAVAVKGLPLGAAVAAQLHYAILGNGVTLFSCELSHDATNS